MTKEQQRKFWKLGVVVLWGEVLYLFVWMIMMLSPSYETMVFGVFLFSVPRWLDFLLCPVYLIFVFSVYLWLKPSIEIFKKDNLGGGIKLASGISVLLGGLSAAWTLYTIHNPFFNLPVEAIPDIATVMAFVLTMIGVSIFGFGAGIIIGFGTIIVMGAGLGFTNGFGTSFIIALGGFGGILAGLMACVIVRLVIQLHKKAFGLEKTTPS